MAVLIALVAFGLFTAGVTVGVIGIVCVAVRREDRLLTLTREPANNVALAGRWLNGVGVRAPGRPIPVSAASTEGTGKRGNDR